MNIAPPELPAALKTWLREPQSLAETGLSAGFLYDLALKAIYFAGELSGQTAANTLPRADRDH